MEVTLTQMLEAREKRTMRQMALIRQWGLPLVSFSMNIPGPVKDSTLIRRALREGCSALERMLPTSAVKHRQVVEAVTGCEAMYVVDMKPLDIKKCTTQIEDTHGLGRLFDMDVICPDLLKLDREQVGGGSRDCIICGAPGRGCASRRVHAVALLQQATEKIFMRYFAGEDARRIGTLAVQSLLEEVYTTPKPGLVDQYNNGSHRDMNLFTFLSSTAALAGYFERCAAIGMDTAGRSPEETFLLLRQAGIQAEQAMYTATGGINTHKGAVFIMGILCGAAGRLWTPEGTWEEETLFREVAAISAKAMAEDMAQARDETNGQRLYRIQGITGIRGEVAEGLPSVRSIGLPSFRAALPKGRNMARITGLLHLISCVEDTNMIARGSFEGARKGAEMAEALLRKDFSLEDVGGLDQWFIQNNLSPGGCADLLAAVCFVHELTGGFFRISDSFCHATERI